MKIVENVKNKGGNTKFYIRTGVSTRELNIEEASKFIANHWQK